MASKEYIERLQMVIRQLHGADSKHVKSVPVLETFKGQTVWQGIVEVFDLTNHPKAKRAYAWSHLSGQDDKDERFVAVLKLPPVTGPHSAVQVAIAAEIKQKPRSKGG